MKLKQITTKEPFKRIKPYTQLSGEVYNGDKIEVDLPNNTWDIIPQEKFLSEINPSGHIVNTRADKRVNNEDGTFSHYQPVAKIAVPIQKIIATKQKIHLTSKDILFTLTEPDRTPDKEKTFILFKQAWKDKNMHVAIAKAVESWLETGDAALYFYRDGGKLGWKDFGFKNNDILLPHYDYYGNLNLFGRLYQGIDEDGKVISKLDVFDKETITTYTKRSSLLGSALLGEWKMEGKPKSHGFNQIPICYKRSNDICSGDVQKLIDSFEEAFSNMSENNRYYANSILFVKGVINSLPNRDNQAKVLQGDKDTDAKFLATPESNQAQMNELEMLLKHIFMGSFTVSVSPETVKSSGDLPGITVKLLFSPAIEKALESAKELDGFIDKAVSLFKEGYGIEAKSSSNFENLKVRGEIDIYVPQNDAELVHTLNESVGYGSLSKETASEVNPLGINGEYERIKSQIATENAGSLDMITNTQI